MGFPVVQVVILPVYQVHPHVKNTSHTIHSVKLDLIIPFSCMHDGVITLDFVLFEISHAIKKTKKIQIKWLIDTFWGVITETNGNKMTLSACD